MVNLFYLLVAVLPLENHWFWRYELAGSFTLLKVLGLVCLGGAAATITQKGLPPEVLRSAPLRWYLAYLAMQGGSYFVHGGEMAVSGDVYLNVLSIVSLAVVTVTMVDSPLRLKRTLLLCIGSAAFASLYTIRGQQGAGLSGFRPSGIFEDANYYALVVGLWIPLAFLWSTSSRTRNERIFCLGCVAVMLLGTTLAASRGGFFGLAAALLFMIWHSRRRFRNLVIVAGATVPLLVLAPNSPLRRLLEPGYGDEKAGEARLIAWAAGLRMVRAHPLTGVGLGNFKPLVTRYNTSDVSVISVAHNTYIETAAELGMPALLIHVGVLLASFLSFGRMRRWAAAVKWQHLYQIALGLQAGVLSYGVGAFFVSSWWQKIPWMLVFLAAVVPYVGERAIERSQERERMRRSSAGGEKVLTMRRQTYAV